ncbi:hypothetical protein [Actinophytocola oryzae]|uniref:Uncharacterized protein n=1 Tax=Actinophytocola oryzae TaxID=502181 RepID=A0A4R7V1C3_9PSEU|nr:hypothetical protein [Actinophytocola oryzae]TDV42282.1 hypothetical protein CLV71_118152 [Actinophytocola oryzae]
MTAYDRLMALLDSRGAEYRLIHHSPEVPVDTDLLADNEILVFGRADVAIALNREDSRWLEAA